LRSQIEQIMMLIKYPIACLEYVIVHELVHLLEPSHNARFVAFMDQFMPDWRMHKERLSESL
jgi:predicted metal-dependent hydrolase